MINKEKIENIKKLDKYELIKESYIEEIASSELILEHKKTKAKILLYLNDDNNKVFTVGFRTPSRDSTGVAHIIEHSVLCGSKKFTLKDPFVELAKGSLKTFLNAMTYSDKTLYPVASTNDIDFRNLLDVYLDAVFYPNIYKEDKIFKQEAWHYELESLEDELKINGVVYNEMKGVFSSGEQIFERSITKYLYEGHSYAEEFGGEPEHIKNLTYEEFLDFHSTYYHPSNSYIYLYGNLDMASTLDFIDKEYLSTFEYKDVDSKIKDFEKGEGIKQIEQEYPISEEESLENACFLSLSTICDNLDVIKSCAMGIIQYLLIDAQGAILKEELLKNNIGQDYSVIFDNMMKYPYFSIIVKGANYEDREKFISVVASTLNKIVKEGLDKNSILAAINVSEFRSREADYGSYPKGLIYGIESFTNWLYDKDPSAYLKYNYIYNELRARVNTDFYENLIKEMLIDNSYKLDLIARPNKSLAKEKEDSLKAYLKDLKASFNEEELLNIIKETKELKEYQKAKDKKEDIDTLPVLKLDEINKNIDKLEYSVDKIDIEDKEYKIITTKLNSSGISYIKLLYNINFLDENEILHAALLRDLLVYLDTKKYSYSEIDTLINLKSGGLKIYDEAYVDIKNTENTNFVIFLKTKVLSENTSFILDLAKSILKETKFEENRLKDLILEIKASLKNRMLSAGHTKSSLRAASKLSIKSLFNELVSGISYYRFIEDISKNFETKKEDLIKNLEEVYIKIFSKDNLSFNFTGDEKGYEIFKNELKKFTSGGLDLEIKDRSIKLNLDTSVDKEAFTSSSMVNYVSSVSSYEDSEYEYTGSLKVLQSLLNYDYLWNNIRVMGGAYGAFSNFSYDKKILLSSYRDPNIKKTYEVYEEIGEFLDKLELDEKELTKLIIGAISEIDTPLNPSAKGRRNLIAYYSNIDNEYLQKERDEILATTLMDLKNLKNIFEVAKKKNIKVMIGNEGNIKENSKLFNNIESLYKE